MRPRDSHNQLAEWMRERTEPTDMFMGPLTLSWLRGVGERPYFVTSKHGGQGVYDRDSAMARRQRVGIVQTLSRCRAPGVFSAIVCQAGVRYAIGNAASRLDLPIAFESEEWVVYDLGDQD